MADYYYEGKGTGRDKGLAKDLYREAANAGNQEAAKILKEL
jgi:TPR repeat protein